LIFPHRFPTVSPRDTFLKITEKALKNSFLQQKRPAIMPRLGYDVRQGVYNRMDHEKQEALSMFMKEI
jgi:hypothetical protein